jgi:5'(3')-deoxyribonucleotidase
VRSEARSAQAEAGGSMKRPIVLLDCDGVLSDFYSGCRAALRARDLHTAADSIRADRSLFGGMTPEAAKVLRDAIEAPGFAAGLEVHAHAQEAVRELSSLCEVVYVTAPWIGSATWASERAAWLAEHFGARKGQVISTHAKWLVRGDIFVDDHLPNVREWAFGNEGATVLWTAQSDEDRRAMWHVVRAIAHAKAGAQ